MELAATAAAEEEDNKRNDDYPGAVVVKKIAKTIVHSSSPFGGISLPPATIL